MQPFITLLIHITISVTSSTLSITAKALIDSSFAGNFISRKFLRHLYLPKIPCKETLNIHSIMGKPQEKYIIMHCSPTLTLCIGCTHHEEILLQVLEGSTIVIILRSSWLQVYSPHISWSTVEILSWGKRCFECLSLPQKSTHQNVQPSISIQVATNKSPNQGCKVKIPTEYRAFQDVFSKQLASKLPPYQPWDCAIELPPGASLPKRKIYPVSISEQKATEEYVEEAYIYLSTSPAGSSPQAAVKFLWSHLPWRL
ncbi:uncharacterized protein LOC125274583 [Megalobrama amblycephala]|uniref:uncharacterized protein LOC125274583 n=1 Tax=Megalobrama amblycephala TaxID=75352 RepID=UPI002013D43A|nr:uncharacterized protein LOC125274583 [Megalobrama amblycephala]